MTGRRIAIGTFGLVVATIAGISITLFFQWRLLKQYLNQFTWEQSIRVYSRPLSVQKDSYVLSSPQFLRSELLEYGYLEVTEMSALTPQTFMASESQVCILPAPNFLPEQPALPQPPVVTSPSSFCVQWSSGTVEIWTQSSQGEHIPLADAVHLPPMLIGFLFPKDNQYEVRTVARLDEIPPELIWAVVTIEDLRFFEHQGIDLKSILRAGWANLRSGRIVQGGSTLTQQLIKNMLLTQEKTLWRKIREAILAYLIETTVSKDEILMAYLNEIYFGSGGLASIYGIKEASAYYFGKSLTDLDLAESTLLAAMINNPGFYVKAANNAKLRSRRNLILDRLLEQGYATAEEVSRAKRVPVVLKQQDFFNRTNYGYILDVVRRSIFQKDKSRENKNDVMTSVDPLIQKLALHSTQTVLSNLRKEKVFSQNPEQKLQGSFLVVWPKTGEILALQGGANYAETQFNRALDAKRQVGSTIKPFVYAAALQLAPQLSPLTPIHDQPIELQTRPDEIWKPKNYKEKYYDWVALRQALENSINVATVKLSLYVGIENLAGIFRQLWPDLPGFYPSSTVGSMELTLTELLERYQLFYHCREGAVLGHHMIYGQQPEQPRGMVRNPFGCNALAQVANMMQGVIERGTAQELKAYVGANSSALMGKTGTTNEGHDSWFVGMEQQLLAGGWMGFDQPEKSVLTGAGGTLHIYGLWMREMIAKGYVPALLTIPNELQNYRVPNDVYERNEITHLLKIPETEWLQTQIDGQVFKTKIE